MQHQGNHVRHQAARPAFPPLGDERWETLADEGPPSLAPRNTSRPNTSFGEPFFQGDDPPSGGGNPGHPAGTNSALPQAQPSQTPGQTAEPSIGPIRKQTSCVSHPAPVPSGTLIRVPSGTLIRVPVVGTLIRVPSGTLIRVPSGTLIRVPLGTLIRVPVVGTLIRVPSGTLIRVPSGTLIRVPTTGTLIRVPLGTLIRVPSGTLIRVPLSTLIRVPLGTLIRVPTTGTLIRVPTGTLIRVPTGTLIRVPLGTLLRVPTGTLIRVPLGTLIRVPRGSRKPLDSRGLREPGRTGVPAVHACPEGVQGLHALRTGVHGQHACLAGLHAASRHFGMLPPFKDVPGAQINKEVSKVNKARLAYLRLMINLNQHQGIIDGDPKTPTFWHQIDDDLQARVGKGRLYKFAFAQLILRKDRALWNGRKTIEDVHAADFALPTENEIAAEID
ncbi:hypothetical protein PCANC_21205 [Puccinia coronata f. sp. avenae]|uniref:Uncharacterized protein n=1 Tax=Puccinia coronata f. sp. avenae TaxID=200324 RepID=A0A2N5UGP6_9BASI|nr:hypothetical protein PCANC_21205 [Puccinia coronata f. sp. avenae]